MMNVTSTPPLKIHAHGDMVLFRVFCHQDLTLKPLLVPLYVIICPITYFKANESRIHDMDAIHTQKTVGDMVLISGVF